MTFVTARKTINHHATSNSPAVEIPASVVQPAAYFRWKRITSPVLACLLLIPGIPIIALLVLLVRLTSPGPGVYRQVRVGRGGRTFKMYKIRTMRDDAEADGGPEWTQKDDPRITPVGRVLRKLHLDEFPQLFNVLKGEMNLIGPRPERPEFTQVLASEIPGYLDRLAVPPGITGLAQINLPPDTDLDSVRRKLVLDLEYVRQANVLLDLRMFISTLLRLLGLKGEYAMKWMGLERNIPFPSPARNGHAGHSAGRRTPLAILAASMAEGRNGAPANGTASASADGNGVHAPDSSNGRKGANGSAKRSKRPGLPR